MEKEAYMIGNSGQCASQAAAHSTRNGNSEHETQHWTADDDEGARILYSMSRGTQVPFQENPHITTDNIFIAHTHRPKQIIPQHQQIEALPKIADETTSILCEVDGHELRPLSANGACGKAPKPGLENHSPETTETTTSDSDETINTPDGDHNSGASQDKILNKIYKVLGKIEDKMLYLTKVEAKSPKSPVRKSNNSGPAPRERKTREREIPKKSHENERANITPKGAAEWMEKAGGDHMKAAEFWVQTEEKSKEPDPLLEKVKTYLEKTKGGSLDHRALELEMEEEEEEEERAEAAKQRKRTRARYLSTDLRGSEQQQPSAVEQTGHILEAREPASSASLQQYRLLSTSEAIPSHPPEKRRRTATDNLESDLGEKWNANVTDDGRRPCTKRQEKMSGHKESSGQGDN